MNDFYDEKLLQHWTKNKWSTIDTIYNELKTLNDNTMVFM